MYSDYLNLFVWTLFAILTIAVLKYDQRHAKERARAEAKALGLEDIADRRIKPYLLLALLMGGLILIIYFWATRKSVKGGLMGFGILCAVTIVTAIAGSAYSVMATSLDHSNTLRACSTLSTNDPDGDDCTSGSLKFPMESQALLESGCKTGLVAPCMWLDLDTRIPFGAANTEESPYRKRAREICASKPASARKNRCPDEPASP